MLIIDTTNNLKKYRTKNSSSQEFFADIMGVHMNTYRRFENNETELPVRHAMTMAEYLNINWWELYNNDNEIDEIEAFYRRFRIIDKEKLVEFDRLINNKNLSREDVVLILSTVCLRRLWVTVKDLIYKLMLAHPDAIVKVVESPEDNPGDDVLDVIDAKTEVLLEYGKDCDTHQRT